MADSTLARIRDQAQHSPFWWLKISGLPYYFFQRIDPVAMGAWTLPTGMTSVLALGTPQGTFEQTLPDLVGGVASPERITLNVNDFQLADAGGPYRFFGRLRAPGRAKTAAGPQWGYLDQDLLQSANVGDHVFLRGPGGFASSGDLFCPGETIGYSAISPNTPTTGSTQFTIAARNKYPCVDLGGGNVWPTQQIMRSPKDATGNTLAAAAIPMYSQPFTLLGRRVALYCGYLNVDGTPCTEANGLRRFVGRIKAINKQDSKYQLQCESVLADLTSAKLAPQLARSSLGKRIIIPDILRYRSFIFGFHITDPNGYRQIREAVITIDAGTYYYEPNSLTQAIQDKIRLAATGVPSPLRYSIDVQPSAALVQVNNVDGEPRVQFRLPAQNGAQDRGITFYVRHGVDAINYGSTLDSTDDKIAQAQADQSLLCALGFPPSTKPFEANYSPSGIANGSSGGVTDKASQISIVLTSPNAPPWIFIPTVGQVSTEVLLTDSGSPGAAFFTNQLDGGGEAYVRFGDGQIVNITAQTDHTITTGQRPGPHLSVFTWQHDPIGYYAVPAGSEGYVEQVILTPSPRLGTQSPTRTAFHFLAANGGESVAFYPPGVGLGWYQLLDAAAWAISVQDVGARQFIIDSTSVWSDYFVAIAKVYGLFVVWDPEQGRITLRRLRTPSPGVDVTYALTESNRSKRDDVSQEEEDFSNIRTGWTIKSGWDQIQQKFTGQTYTITDYFPIAAYGSSIKLEEVADRSLTHGASIGAVLTQLLNARSPFVQSPWNKITRTINKCLQLMSPGQIVGPLVDLHATSPAGAEGMVAADGVYGLLYSVSSDPETGEGQAVVLLNGTSPPEAVRRASPAGLVDITKDDGGTTYTRGFKQISAGNIRLWMARHYTQNANGAYKDGIDFTVGDVCRITHRDNAGAAVVFDATITLVEATGAFAELISTMVLGDVPTDSELILIWALYGDAVLRQQTTGAFQAGGDKMTNAGDVTGLFL